MRIAITIAAVLATGCVKESTHKKAVAKLQAELTAARAEVAARDKRIAELEGNTATLRGESESLRGETAALRGEKEATAAELAELREKKAADEKRLAAFQDLQERFKTLVDTGELEVAFRNGQMTLKLPSGVLFPSAGAELGDGGKKTLTEVTKILMPLKDRMFLVAGHTDNVPIKTDAFANNWYLSTARAITVVQFMIDQGFPADHLAAAGYADKDPIGNNKTKTGRKKNRRIEIIFVPDLSELPKLTIPAS
jgi:chemotaxis protein MotB